MHIEVLGPPDGVSIPGQVPLHRLPCAFNGVRVILGHECWGEGFCCVMRVVLNSGPPGRAQVGTVLGTVVSSAWVWRVWGRTRGGRGAGGTRGSLGGSSVLSPTLFPASQVSDPL